MESRSTQRLLSQVNANLTLSTGTHRVTVQGRDSQGMFTKTVNLTVL